MAQGAYQRKQFILKIAKDRKFIEIDKLADELNVSAQTVRRDINEFCDKNLLRRRHGGAEYVSSASLNTPYQLRHQTNAKAKQAIGKITSTLIPDGATIFISIGTTPEIVAQNLINKKQLTVVTNSMYAAMALSREASNRIIMPGGEMRLPDNDFLGGHVLDLFHKFRADFGIYGVGGVDRDGVLLDFHNSEVEVRECIKQQSRETILVMDDSKFGRAAPAIGGHLNDANHLVMNKPPQAEFKHLLDDLECNIHFAEDKQ